MKTLILQEADVTDIEKILQNIVEPKVVYSDNVEHMKRRVIERVQDDARYALMIFESLKENQGYDNDKFTQGLTLQK